jgi:hypothetical protein
MRRRCSGEARHLVSGQADTSTDQLARLLSHRRADGMSDGQMLQQFLATRDEAAFAALMQRHGPMV